MARTRVIRTYRPTNHTAHVIACILSGGLWIPGYLWCHHLNKTRPRTVQTHTIYDDAEFAPHADSYGGRPRQPVARQAEYWPDEHDDRPPYR